MSAQPGTPLPAVSLPKVGGGTASVGPGWSMLVVYRGRHCPRCKSYLNKLNTLLDGFAGLDVSVVVTSCDPEDRASTDRDEFGWNFTLCHSLSLADASALGCYLSDPASANETDRPFAEPGLFVVNPDGLLHVVGVSNAASCRPDLDVVLDGIRGIQMRGLPIRGRRGL